VSPRSGRIISPGAPSTPEGSQKCGPFVFQAVVTDSNSLVRQDELLEPRPPKRARQRAASLSERAAPLRGESAKRTNHLSGRAINTRGLTEMWALCVSGGCYGFEIIVPPGTDYKSARTKKVPTKRGPHDHRVVGIGLAPWKFSAKDKLTTPAFTPDAYIKLEGPKSTSIGAKLTPRLRHRTLFALVSQLPLVSLNLPQGMDWS